MDDLTAKIVDARKAARRGEGAKKCVCGTGVEKELQITDFKENEIKKFLFCLIFIASNLLLFMYQLFVLRQTLLRSIMKQPASSLLDLICIAMRVWY